MKYNALGTTGLQVSRIGLGTATFGIAPLAADADHLIGRALDLGLNLVDTANSYGNQPRFDRAGAPPAAQREAAETIVGRALAGRRREVILCSKVMEPVGDGPNDRGLSRRHILDQVEHSLARLRTDHLDIYYAHHPDPMAAPEEMLRAFDDLRRQGKIRYGGLSTYPAWQTVEAAWLCDRLGLAPPACVQIAYNLANRLAEREILPACRRLGLGVTVFSPLAGGLLAGPEVRHRPIAGGRRWGAPGFSASQIAVAESLEALAAEAGASPATLALAWLADQPGVGCALVGPETVQELEDNAVGASFAVDPGILDRLSRIVAAS